MENGPPWSGGLRCTMNGHVVNKASKRRLFVWDLPSGHLCVNRESQPTETKEMEPEM